MEEKTMESQPNQQVLEQTSVAVEEKKVKPPTIVILLVAILLVGVGGIYAGMQIGKKQTTPTIIPQPTVIPSPNETVYTEQSRSANWKTYTNTKYGYSFKYPERMEVLECSQENIYPVEKDRQYDPCHSGAGGFSISIISEDMTSSLSDWYYRDYNVTKSNTVLDGRPAVKFLGNRSSDTPAPIPQTINIITMPYNGKTLVINQADNDNQILSSFKFLD